jgi:hypothetical protein
VRQVNDARLGINRENHPFHRRHEVVCGAKVSEQGDQCGRSRDRDTWRNGDGARGCLCSPSPRLPFSRSALHWMLVWAEVRMRSC